MDQVLLLDIPGLDPWHRNALQKAHVSTVSDLFLTSAKEISQKCRLPASVVDNIISIVAEAMTPTPQPLGELSGTKPESFTTGEPLLDTILGSGIRTGMLWEIVGESAAGKTQLALQLSLAVQLDAEHSGLSGSACYLTTSASLPTNRLLEMIQHRPDFIAGGCSLNNVHTIEAPTTHIMMHVLNSVLPEFINSQNKHHRPVKLLIIDAIAELFHQDDKTTTQSLVTRSREIGQIASRLHALATTHRLAVVVLNEVSESFATSNSTTTTREYPLNSEHHLFYNEQSKWFNRAEDVPGGSTKEASLGLVWANQVNTRIFLHRTRRRVRMIVEEESSGSSTKRPRLLDDHADETPSSFHSQGDHVLLRRLNVVFSSVGPRAAIDYIVTVAGIVAHQAVLMLEHSTNQQTSALQTNTDSSPRPTTELIPLENTQQSSESTLPTFLPSPDPNPQTSSQSMILPLDFGIATTANGADDPSVPSSQDEEITFPW